MTAVTLTGRLLEIPRLSIRTNSRSGVRTTFEIEGLHSGVRVQMHATEAVAERITAELLVGDVITATCLSEERTNRRGDRIRHTLFVESFTRHPRGAVALPDEKPADEEADS